MGRSGCNCVHVGVAVNAVVVGDEGEGFVV
jgi:hypothetical protein